MRSGDGYDAPEERCSPECVEGLFSDARSTKARFGGAVGELYGVAYVSDRARGCADPSIAPSRSSPRLGGQGLALSHPFSLSTHSE